MIFYKVNCFDGKIRFYSFKVINDIIEEELNFRLSFGAEKIEQLDELTFNRKKYYALQRRTFAASKTTYKSFRTK
jgi:hypothetical protein